MFVIIKLILFYTNFNFTVMKTIPKIIFILLAVAGIFTTLGFRKVNHNGNQQNTYVYIYFHDKDDYNKVYVSDICYYSPDSDKCAGGFRNWSLKAEAAFRAYIKSQYNEDVKPFNGNMFSIRTTVSTVEKARDELNALISKQTADKRTVKKINFTYSCE
ncbi:hypothetical protein D1631_17335 [Chryseobacterium nematophagum]|uniref:Uncharacterized protein n=2 Tax=Chryseobacterium nematophagum TaxID=2305228 RepID=A0A3M7TMQ6_9FLAO|nr:hypothetical protein D1631_17335 [Chryseobacterium nematophagum]